MAEGGELHFKATLDTASYAKGAKEIRDQIVETKKQVEQTGMGVDDFAKSIGRIIESMGKMTASIDNNTKAQEESTAATKKATKAIDESASATDKLGKEIDETSSKGEKGFSRLEKAAAGLFTLAAAQQFASKIYDVRSEIQKLETSFRILVGDKDKADQLFSGIKTFAATTPMQMQDLASAAQTMMGFGIPVEQIMENLKALGDVSMGDTQRFQALSLAFSQVSASGKLMGQDLMQMINAGFNPLAVIAEKTGKSIGTLKDEMSAGSISADMVRQAFIDATSEGGKFYGMLEAQSKTLEGAYSNLKGAINDALNSIGEKTEGVFLGAINLGTELAQNWQKVGVVCLGLVGTFGLYKAAVMAVTAAEKGWTIVEGIHYAWLVAQEKAQKMLNATMLANPYVSAAVALGVLVTAVAAFCVATKEADKANKEINDTFAKTQAEIASEQKEIDRLFDKLRKAKEGTSEYKSAKDAILSQYGSYLSGLSSEVASLKNVEGAYKAVSRAAREAAMARGMEAAMRTATDRYGESYSENYDALSERLTKRIGKANADALMKQVRKDLQEKGRVSKFTQRLIMTATNNRSATEYDAQMNNGQTTDAFKFIEALNANEAQYKANRENIEAKFGPAQESKKETAKDTIRDEKAIQEEKKQAEAQLKALSTQEALGKKGAALKRKIRDLDNELNKAYGVGSDAKDAKAHAVAIKQQQQADQKALQEAIKAGEAEEKQAELRLKQQKENARAEKDLEFSTREAIIKGKEDSTDKLIEQINLDYDREMETIRRGTEDLKQKRIDEAKALWDADPNNKGKNFYESSAFSAANVNSEAELNNQIEQERAATQEWMRRRQEVYQAETDAMNNYLKAYGTYQEQRLSIESEYDQKIADARTEGEKLMLGKQKDEELRQVDERFGLVTQAMADLFADASKKSVKAIQAIIDKYEKLVEYMEGHKGSASKDDLAALGFSDADIQRILRGEISIKDLTDRLKELKGELKQKSPYQSFIGNMKDAIAQLKKATTKEEKANAFGQIASSIKDALPALKEFGSEVANIFGKDDSKFSSAIDGLDGMMTAGQGVAQIMSGDIVGGAMSAVKGISQMVDAFDGMFGADYSSYNNMVEQYDRLIDVWDTLLDRKQEYIDMSYGPEATKAGQEAIDIIEKQTEAYRNLGREWLNSGASAGSHSQGVRQRKKMNSDDWANVAAALGRTTDNYAGLGGRLEGLFSLSAEELRKLQEQAPEFWAKLNDETQKYLQGIIDGEQKIEDIQKQVNEQLTSTTFDSLKDSFANALYDMESTADKAGENIGEALFKSIVDNFILGDDFDQWLQGFYEKWAKKIGSGTMTKRDWDEYNAEYQRELGSRMAQRDAWAQAVGYTGKSGSDSEGSATYNAVKSFTQEQGDVLNGRLTAIQIGVREGNVLRQQIIASLNAMSELTQASGSAIDDMRDLMAVSNTHLADIVTLNKKMLSEFGDKIERIAVNTQNL